MITHDDLEKIVDALNSGAVTDVVNRSDVATALNEVSGTGVGYDEDSHTITIQETDPDA